MDFRSGCLDFLSTLTLGLAGALVAPSFPPVLSPRLVSCACVLYVFVHAFPAHHASGGVLQYCLPFVPVLCVSTLGNKWPFPGLVAFIR